MTGSKTWCPITEFYCRKSPGFVCERRNQKNLLFIGGLNKPPFQALSQALSVGLSLSLLVSALLQHFIDFQVSGELKCFMQIFNYSESFALTFIRPKSDIEGFQISLRCLFVNVITLPLSMKYKTQFNLLFNQSAQVKCNCNPSYHDCLFHYSLSQGTFSAPLSLET